MRRPLCIFSCIFLVMLVAKIEWSDWNQDPERASGQSRPEGRLALQNVHISQRALESHELQVASEAAVVLDAGSGEVLFKKNMEERLPIASLTKLMSALTFLESSPHLDDFTTITASDADCTDQTKLKAGETLTFRDLLHACLMSSSNRATKALARASGLSLSEFVGRMNRKAGEMGLSGTFFSEPTGLSRKNTSTALDCARLLYFALQDSIIASVSGKAAYQFVSLDPSRSVHSLRSANGLLFDSLKVRGTKSGYNGASGWCLGAMVEGQDGEQMVAVVLGAPDKSSRYKDVRSIMQWSLEGKRKGS
jgi:D-alanyl-D-alanine endopeptidase (penicillin-binding protein 7)